MSEQNPQETVPETISETKPSTTTVIINHIKSFLKYFDVIPSWAYALVVVILLIIIIYLLLGGRTEIINISTIMPEPMSPKDSIIARTNKFYSN